MKQSQGLSLVLIAAGFSLFALVSYDAGILARAIGVPVQGGEAVVVAAAQPMALLLLVFGARGLRRVPVKP